MASATLDPNDKPFRNDNDRYGSPQVGAGTTAPVEEQPENPYHIAVDELDAEALKRIQRAEMPYGALRLWWEPFASRRGQGQIKPTHVTIVAETEGERAFALKLLNEDRVRRELAKKVVGHGRTHDKKPTTAADQVCDSPEGGAVKPDPKPSSGSWPYGFGGSETF